MCVVIMMLAKNESGERILATPGMSALCPICDAEVIAKCGEINIWHWAHRGGHDCDPWSEHESEWHIGWKSIFPKEQTEVVIGPHRADIVTESKTVVELQHSSISTVEIREREQFYGNMVWIFDASLFLKNIDFICKGWSVDNYHTYVYTWKRPRKSISVCKNKLFFDLGNSDIIEVKKILIGSDSSQIFQVATWAYQEWGVSRGAFDDYGSSFILGYVYPKKTLMANLQWPVWNNRRIDERFERLSAEKQKQILQVGRSVFRR